MASFTNGTPVKDDDLALEISLLYNLQIYRDNLLARIEEKTLYEQMELEETKIGINNLSKEISKCLSPGKYLTGDYQVTVVKPTARFNPEKAEKVLLDDEKILCTEMIISRDKAKKYLSPTRYEECCDISETQKIVVKGDK